MASATSPHPHPLPAADRGARANIQLSKPVRLTASPTAGGHGEHSTVEARPSHGQPNRRWPRRTFNCRSPSVSRPAQPPVATANIQLSKPVRLTASPTAGGHGEHSTVEDPSSPASPTGGKEERPRSLWFAQGREPGAESIVRPRPAVCRGERVGVRGRGFEAGGAIRTGGRPAGMRRWAGRRGTRPRRRVARRSPPFAGGGRRPRRT